VVDRLAPCSKLLRAWELKGGVSARVTVLEIERPGGQRQKMLVRQHGEVDLRLNPQIAADEFRLLQLLRVAGLATPEPYYFDQAGDIFSTPYIVIEYIEGKTEFTPADGAGLIPQFAAHLASIHALDCAQVDLSFLPDQAQRYTAKLRARPERLDETLDEGHMRDLLEAAWPFPQRNPSALLHGDFWPGNILWRDGQIVAVIDWEDATVGDPLEDLANSRLEMLWAFGLDAMRRFTNEYQALMPIDFTNLPYWDLCAALRPASRIAEWAGDESNEKHMRTGHRLFINQAFEKLNS